MKKFNIYFVALLAIASYSLNTKAAVSLLGVGTQANPETNSSIQVDSDIGYGGAILLSGGSMVSVETGAIYFKRKFELGYATFGHNVLQIPLGVRIGTDFISAGLGGFANFGMGDMTINGFTISYQDASIEKFEYGVYGSIRLGVPLAPTVSFSVEGRYNYNLSNSFKSAVAEWGHELNHRDFMVLAGVTLSL